MLLLLQHASTLFNTSCIMSGHWWSEVCVIAAAIVIFNTVPNMTHPTPKGGVLVSWWACGGNGSIFAQIMFFKSAIISLKSVWGDFSMHLCLSNKVFWHPIHLLLTTACSYSGSWGCWGLSQHSVGVSQELTLDRSHHWTRNLILKFFLKHLWFIPGYDIIILMVISRCCSVGWEVERTKYACFTISLNVLPLK